ncbi:uncharacterized protein LOC100210922 isoform X9 [Hydra vulgaris]|uniref:uncharacterized protein LOC100210922 isoform X9 n=1 Tax=Hydra vulgaris TaxID=6087 RepID=UPI0032E9DEFA
MSKEVCCDQEDDHISQRLDRLEKRLNDLQQLFMSLSAITVEPPASTVVSSSAATVVPPASTALVASSAPTVVRPSGTSNNVAYYIYYNLYYIITLYYNFEKCLYCEKCLTLKYYNFEKCLKTFFGIIQNL